MDKGGYNVKAFVIMFNRLTWAKALCEYLADNGCEVILIDNGSTYKPLLDWYETNPFKIHRLPDTYGHKSLWQSGIIEQYTDPFYIVTDHDLDLSNVPGDFVDKLFEGLEYPNIVKSGLSLKIGDLPKNQYTDEVIKWEQKFWSKKRYRSGFYFSDIDTTLALYDAQRVRDCSEQQFFKAVRAPKPYEARHLPWYNTPDNLTEEEKYYMEHVKTAGYWSQKFKQAWS